MAGNGRALVGVALMIGDGLAYGRTAGNIVALVSSLTFAIMLVLARRSGKSDVLGGTFLGGAGCVCLVPSPACHSAMVSASRPMT